MNLSKVSHNPCLEELTNLICTKTQNTDTGFFHVEIAYFLTKLASCMRAYIETKDRGDIPINMYALCLATSGYSKGHSVNIMENEIISGFRKIFCNSTFKIISDHNLNTRANNIAALNATDPDEEKQKLANAFERTGEYLFTFDSGTTPAIKQLRQKLLLGGIGSINYQCDEVGNNLLSSTEVLNTYLELFDQGLVKPKLIKNTNDSKRDIDIDGKTPANMLMFGTPVRVFDGGSTEDYFYSMLETGYARRLIFGLGKDDNSTKAYKTKTAAEIYRSIIDPSIQSTVTKWNQKLASLADSSIYNFKIILNDDEAILLKQYEIDCKEKADKMSEFHEVHKAELSHRYFKALKLAGTFAFIDKNPILKEEYLLQAIKLVEESGENFQQILTREKPYMKLAKYLAETDTELTHADLNEALPFYKTSTNQRNELISLATAWGYKHQIIIKKTFADNIEFFKGETIKQTDLNRLIISYSDDYANGYFNDYGIFNQLDKVFLANNFNWCSHHFNNGHRSNKDTLPTFNLVVLDVDGSISLNQAQYLLNEYTYVMYTTKRSTPERNRFRIILPISHVLKMDTEEYREFMNNIISWVPFEVDEACNQICKKWESCSFGFLVVNEGSLLNPFQFIPHTSRNEEYLKNQKKVSNMDKLEHWFAERIQNGNRNNQMLKFGLCLVDGGLPYEEIEQRILNFNKELTNGLSIDELRNSVLITVRKHCDDRDLNNE